MNTYTANYLLSLPASEVKAIMTGTTGWKQLRAMRGLVSAKMSKAEMISTVLELQNPSLAALRGALSPAPMIPLIIPAAPAAPAAPVAPAPGSMEEAWAKAPEAATDDEIEAPEPEDTEGDGSTFLDDPLASLRGVLSPALLAQADEAVASIVARSIRAEVAAAEARAEAAQQAYVPAPAGTASTPSRAPLRQTGTKTLRTVLGCGVGRYSDVSVPVFASPDAPAIDLGYLWPDGSGLLLATLTRGRPIFIFGDAGTGKTTFGEQWAARTGRPHFAISFASDKASYDLVGQKLPDGTGAMAWDDGELLAAMQVPGAVISLEELGFARSELVAHLLSALEGGVVHLAGRKVRVAPGVQFMATNNDDGTGSRAGLYAGVRPINKALLDRFAARWEFVALSAERETRAVLNRCPGLNPDVARIMVDYRKSIGAAVERGECEHGVGIRRLVAWGQHVAQGLPSEDGFKGAVLNASPADDAEFYQQTARKSLDHAGLDALQAGKVTAPAPAPEAPAEVPTERHGFPPF